MPSSRPPNLPRHPLEALGFASVGCVPCTGRPPRAAALRDGRWSGLGKTECGIHTGPLPAASPPYLTDTLAPVTLRGLLRAAAVSTRALPLRRPPVKICAGNSAKGAADAWNISSSSSSTASRSARSTA